VRGYGPCPTVPGFPDLEAPLANRPVMVRLGAERDIPEVLIAYQDDPELHLRMGRVRPPSGAELGRLAERADADRAAGREVTLTILEGSSDTCRGQVRVHRVEWENARAELCMWVVPESRGRGLGRGALALVAWWLIGKCGLERVQITTGTDNEPMIRSARAAGFSYEGVLRKYTRERGSRVDNAMLAIVGRDLAG